MKLHTNICALSLIITSLVTTAEEPRDIRNIKSQYEKAIIKVNETYIKELNTLKTKYTKKGDLDNANHIVSIINKTQKNIKSSPQISNKSTSYLGKWILTEPNYTGIFDFRTDGSVIDDKTGSNIRWFVDGRYLIVAYPDGGAKVFSSTIKNNTLERLGRKGGYLKRP